MERPFTPFLSAAENVCDGWSFGSNVGLWRDLKDGNHMLWVAEQKENARFQRTSWIYHSIPGLPIFWLLLCEKLNPSGLSHWGQLSVICS